MEDVYYLQSQNGNLYSSNYFTSADAEGDCELVSLRGDVPAEIPWCSEALASTVVRSPSQRLRGSLEL